MQLVPGAALLVLLLRLAAAAGIAPALVPSGGLPNLLRVGQPILEADRRLRRQGWHPAAVSNPDAVDRERAGNGLASLSACSGSGSGFCRYDYHRGPVSLSVITLPAAPGEAGGARVLRWTDGASGRSWGLCQGDGGENLVPCGGR